MITLKTDIKTLNRKEMKLLNESLIEACSIYMGRKKGLKVKMVGRGSKYFGQYDYDENVIKIWKKSCSGMLGCIGTKLMLRIVLLIHLQHLTVEAQQILAIHRLCPQLERM